jgi:tRNA(fMet)-specific endonuclease VapC
VVTRLLDTNIVSYLLKGHPLGARYRPHLVGYAPAVSFMTVAEFYEGAMLAGWGNRRWTTLHALLGQILALQSSDALSARFGDVRLQRAARPISVAYGWIAATALAHGLELVTHNPADFQGIANLRIVTEAP